MSDPWSSVEFDQHEQICFFAEPKTGLRSIVAIHSTVLGAAAGGTRFYPYANDRLAIDDALRLSKAMSYKCALAGLPCGGGKAVIIGDPERLKTRALLHAYGEFINRIGTTFATGEDVGMSVRDIETVREVSPYVGGTSHGGAGDPAQHTATGLVHGLRAVLRTCFDREDFQGVSIAIQGLGAVGWGLAERLHAQGARLVVADMQPEKVARAVATFGATSAPVDAIHRATVDIFSPCAMGGVITERSAREINAKAVAGAANNQLATPAAGEVLAARGILYAPDYVINAGGIISGLEEYFKMPGRSGVVVEPLEVRLAAIGQRLEQIFVRSRAEGKTPEKTAEELARELIRR